MTNKKSLDNKISIAQLLTALIVICFGIGMIYFGWQGNQTVNKNMQKDCKMCSVFKDCPYTNEELMEEEYGNGPCSDMGTYELLWKGSLVLVFMGIGLIIIGIYNVFSELYSKLKENQDD